MKLTPEEQAMAQGQQGPAVARAMDLLIRYGQALGAERLVPTRNVVASVNATTPFMRDFAQQLKAAGHRVRYIAIDDASNRHTVCDNLQALERHGHRCQRRCGADGAVIGFGGGAAVQLKIGSAFTVCLWFEQERDTYRGRGGRLSAERSRRGVLRDAE